MYMSNKCPRIVDVILARTGWTGLLKKKFLMTMIMNHCQPMSFVRKMTKSPFIEKDEWASDVLDLVHTDVFRLMSTSAREGYHYFIMFTDDLSRYGYIYLMKHKSESFEMFKQFCDEVKK